MTSSLALPTTELKENRAQAFSNGDDTAVSKPMNSRRVATMAFAAAFFDELAHKKAAQDQPLA